MWFLRSKKRGTIPIESEKKNDEKYIKAYIYDRFHLTSDGPNKIKSSLINEGMDKNIIEQNI